MIALLCLFGGISIASWNALDVLTVELYPSDKRWAKFGFLSLMLFLNIATIVAFSLYEHYNLISQIFTTLFGTINNNSWFQICAASPLQCRSNASLF